MADGNFTLFKAGGGGSSGSGSGDYVKDAFEDISTPATNNSGLGSSTTTNPVGQFFANSDAPQYGPKTLWVKGFNLLDRDKWENGRPTYEVKFTEDLPNIFAYVVGNARLLNRGQGVEISVRTIGDVIGVTGKIVNAAWILNPQSATGTADILVDGSDTGDDVTFGGADSDAVSEGISGYYVAGYRASNATNDLHDFRLQANENLVLSVAGLIVYFENADASIECLPGSTYLDKTKLTTANGATLALPSISGRLGAVTTIYKDSTGAYDSFTLEPEQIESIGQGASGGTSIDVTTGHGASFIERMGVVGVASGSSYYVGQITSISTDTLTVSPALNTGLSGPLYSFFRPGPTLSISASFYIKSFSFDPAASNNPFYDEGFGVESEGNFYYSDPEKRYRIWGDTLTYVEQDGYNGVGFVGASPGFLQVEGKFSAAEMILASGPGATPSVAHFDVGINGISAAFSINEGFTGLQAKTLFTNAGPGVNSVVINAGASISNCIIQSISFYQLAPSIGFSGAPLAYFETHVDKVNRTAYNATMMQLGMNQRVYADEIYFEGPWSRSLSSDAAGGVRFIGTTTTCEAQFNYYGSDFAVIGSGGSVLITLDGATTGISQNFNELQGVATLGFHSVQIANLGATTVVEAIDHYRPRGEIVNVQNFLSTPEQDDAIAIYQQSSTPRNPKPGDIWATNPTSGNIWIYLFNQWNKLSVEYFDDDPNEDIFVRAGGSSSADTNMSSNVVGFNSVTWQTLASMPTARGQGSGSQGQYKGNLHCTDGYNNSGSIAQAHQVFTGSSWSSTTNTPATRMRQSVHTFNNFFYVNGGSADASTPSNSCYKWNGSAWLTSTNWGTAKFSSGAFVVGAFVYMVDGFSLSAAVQRKNSADSNSTAASLPGGAAPGCGATVDAGNEAGLIFATESTAGTTSRLFDGSSWTSPTAAYSAIRRESPGTVFFPRAGGWTCTGGDSSGALATTQIYNRVAFALTVDAPNGRSSVYAGAV